MAEEIHEIAVLPKAGTLILNSGNIINWNRLKRKPIQTPTEEISECIASTLKAFLSTANENHLQYVTDLVCVNQKSNEGDLDSERGDLKITVKIFLCMLLSPGIVKEALEQALKDLGVTFIETVILAFPEIENKELTLESIQPYWRVMEGFVEGQQILSLGIADLDKNLLERLYDWANVKPVVNQVNLDSCCVMPQDLVEYAKQKDIQLLTHNDPRNVLPAETLQEVIGRTVTEKDSVFWEPSWILRYSILVKCRGIVQSKGYLMKATRDIKKRK